jgi:hypothetical protein
MQATTHQLASASGFARARRALLPTTSMRRPAPEALVAEAQSLAPLAYTCRGCGGPSDSPICCAGCWSLAEVG